MQFALKNIFDYFAEHPELRERSWLILGKGPSFALRSNWDLSNYKILSLNDAARECNKTDLAHFIDFEAYERCAQALSRNPRVLVVMPWFPHFNHKAGEVDLARLSEKNTTLSKFAQEGRLYWYDLISSRQRYGDYPVVSVNAFSAEAALDLLAMAGVRYIRSLGIDGGKAYSNEFSDLTSISLLANSQKSFDKQFKAFCKVITKTNVNYSPLDMDSPIRIYIASSPSEALPVKVLEYSIKQHASSTVSVTPLCDVGIPLVQPVASENRPRTPFSFQRFLIPQVCNYSGHAIYLDSDMLVFKDIMDLWCRPFGEANVLSAYSASDSGRKQQYSVMLMDCSRLLWNIQEIIDQLNTGVINYEQLMYEFSLAKTAATIEPYWNSLETYKAGQTALLHYTDMTKQPWVSCLNPLGYLWVRTLREAVRNGAISREFIVEEVNRGHVRPSLLYQLDNSIDDPILLPKKALIQDSFFIPPYCKIRTHQASPWSNHLLWLRAKLRSKYQKTIIYKLQYKIRKKLIDSWQKPIRW